MNNQNISVLASIVNSHRDFDDFSVENIADVLLCEDENNELAEQMLAVLAEDPQYAAQITLLQSSSSKSIGVDVAVIVAVSYLLRTHIKITHSEAGQWSLLVEHKPSDSKTLEALLNRLSSLMKV